jgi:hypothetical protein
MGPRVRRTARVKRGQDAILIDFQGQKNYIDARQGAGKDIESHVYQGGRRGLVADPANKDDATRRRFDFLRRRLKAGG